MELHCVSLCVRSRPTHALPQMGEDRSPKGLWERNMSLFSVRNYLFEIRQIAGVDILVQKTWLSVVPAGGDEVCKTSLVLTFELLHLLAETLDVGIVELQVVLCLQAFRPIHHRQHVLQLLPRLHTFLQHTTES